MPSRQPGDTIIVYGIGFGQTSPAAVEGQAASSTTLQAIQGVGATFGGGFTGLATAGKVSFAGLTPTAVGLYQINVVIPSNTPLGNSIPVMASVGGVPSNQVYLAITASGK